MSDAQQIKGLRRTAVHRNRGATSYWWRRGTGLLVAVAVLMVSGCLGEPEIDKRWTLLEFLNVTPQPGVTATAGQPLDVTVKGRVTYRRIITGFVVAEVRYSQTLTSTSVTLDPDEHTAEVAADVDMILANSVTAGRATRIVTGWDHLMQDLDLSFTAQIPSTPGGVFLLLYMGDGEEIELPSGQDSLVVTPFVSTDYEVLHTGFELEVVP
jgi:hypothetical protein